MGLFNILCSKCGKEFHWFSGLPYQICDECAIQNDLQDGSLSAYNPGQATIDAAVIQEAASTAQEQFGAPAVYIPIEEIDWEQRQWDLFKRCLSGGCTVRGSFETAKEGIKYYQEHMDED
jgi:hypothetical protein